MRFVYLAAVAAAMALTFGTACAQIYKCGDSKGRTTYSQSPCPGEGRLLDPNRPSIEPPQELTQRRGLDGAQHHAPLQAAQHQQQASQPAGQRRQCADELTIRNLETSASSITLDQYDRQVYAEQIRRAKACEELMTPQQMELMKMALMEERRRSRPLVVTGCDASGCTGSDGTRFNSAGGGTYVRQDGTTCHAAGSILICD